MASEADIPESMQTQTREEDNNQRTSQCTTDINPVEHASFDDGLQTLQETTASMKEVDQGKNRVEETKGDNESTDGGIFLYSPTVGKVAYEDMDKLSEDHLEPRSSDQAEMKIIPETNNQQPHNKKPKTTEEEIGQITVQLSLHAEGNGVTKEVIFVNQEVQSGPHTGEALSDIEWDKKENSEIGDDIYERNNFIEDQAVTTSVFVPGEILEGLKTEKESDSIACDQKPCIETLGTDPKAFEEKVEATIYEEGSEKQCTAAVGGLEEIAESEKGNVKDGFEETLCTGTANNVVSQIGTIFIDRDEQPISENVEDDRVTGTNPLEVTELAEEKICMQEDGRDITLEDASNCLFQENCHDIAGSSEKLKYKITAEDNRTESSMSNLGEGMDQGGVHKNEAQTLLSEANLDVTVKEVVHEDNPQNERPRETAEENLEINSNTMVPENDENLHQVAQSLALEQAPAEKERGNGGRNIIHIEPIGATECVGKAAIKEEEEEGKSVEESVKMVMEDIKTVEATDETALAKQGDIIVSIPENQVTRNEELEADYSDTAETPQHNTSEADVKETTGSDESHIVQNENGLSHGYKGVDYPLEKEGEEQNVSSSFVPKEQEVQETEGSLEERIHNQQPSVAPKSREFIISEANPDEEAAANGLNLTTRKTEEGKFADFLESGPEKRQETSRAGETMETASKRKSSQSELQKSRIMNEEEEEPVGEDTPEAVHTSQQTGPETITQSLPVSILEIKESSISSESIKRSEEDGNDGSDLPIEKGKNSCPLLGEEDMHEIMKNAMQENFQDDTTENRNLQLGMNQKITEDNHLTDIMSISTVEKIAEHIKNETKEEKSTKEIEEPETATPQERIELHTCNVTQSLNKILDSSIEKCEGCSEGDNQILPPKESLNEENQEEMTSALAVEEIGDTAPLNPEESNLLKSKEKIEQAPLTSDPEAQALNMWKEIGNESVPIRNPEMNTYMLLDEVNSNSREISDDVTANMAEKLIDLSYQGDRDEKHCFDKAAANPSQTISEEDNVTTNATKGEITECPGTEIPITEESTEEFTNSNKITGESAQKVERELYQANGVEYFQTHTSKEDAACRDQPTDHAKETTKNSCTMDRTDTKIKGDDGVITVPLTEIVESSSSSQLPFGEDDATISAETEKLSDLNKTADKDTIAGAEYVSKESVNKQTEDEKCDTLFEKENKTEDFLREKPSAIIQEEIKEASSMLPTTQLDISTPDGIKIVDETPLTMNSREGNEFQPEDQSKNPNETEKVTSVGTEKESTGQEDCQNKGTLECCTNSAAASNDSVISAEADNLATKETSILMEYQDATSAEHLSEGLEIELKDENSINREGDAKQEADALELDKRTKRFNEEMTEEELQHDRKGEQEDDEETPEDTNKSKTAELDSIAAQRDGNTDERSMPNAIDGTDMMKVEESNSGKGMENQETLQASNPNINAENPVPGQDVCIKISNDGIQTLEDQEEATICEQHHNPEDKVQSNISYGVSAEEVKSVDDNEDPPQLENERNMCMSDNVQVQEDTKLQELCKSSEFDGSDFVKGMKIMSQVLQENNSFEVQNQQTFRGIKASEQNVGEDMDNLSQEESPEMSDEKTQVEIDKAGVINAECPPQEHEGPENIKRISAEQNPEQGNPAENLQSYSNSTATCQCSSKAEERDFQVIYADTSLTEEETETVNADDKNYVPKEPVPSTEAKTSEQFSLIEDNPYPEDVQAPKLYVQNEGIKEGQQQEIHCGQSANMLGTENTELGDDLSKEPGASLGASIPENCTPSKEENHGVDSGEAGNKTQTVNLDMKDDLSEESDVSMAAKTSENGAPSEESQSSGAVWASDFDIPEEEEKNGISEESNASITAKTSEEYTSEESHSSGDVLAPDLDIKEEDIKEEQKHSAECGETMNKTEELKTNLSEESDVSTAAKTSEECAILEENESFGEVLTPEYDIEDDIEEEEKHGAKCDEAENKTETVRSKSEDYLSEKPDASIAARTSDEFMPLEQSQSSTDVLAPELYVPEAIKEEEKHGVKCDETENKKESVTSEIKDDLPEPDASFAAKTSEECAALEESEPHGDVLTSFDINEEGTKEEKHEIKHGETANKTEIVNSEIKDDLTEEPDSLVASKTSEECATVEKSEPYGDIQASRFDIKEEGTKEEDKHGIECGETIDNTETVNSDINDNLSEEPDASFAAKTSEECAPLKESKLSGDFLAIEFDTPEDATKEEGKQEVDYDETAKTETVNSEVHDDSSEVPGAPIATKKSDECATLGLSQSPEDVLATQSDIPKEDINEEEQGVDCGQTANMTETVNEVKTEVSQELQGSLATKTSEEHAPLIESQSSKDVLPPVFDIPREDSNEEKQGIDSGETADKKETVTAEVSRSFEDVLAPEHDISKEDIKEAEMQGEHCGETTNEKETLKDESKDYSFEELGAPVAAKMSDGCAPLDESHLSEDVLLPEFDTSKEGDKVEQGVESGVTKNKTEILNTEVNDDQCEEPSAPGATSSLEEFAPLQESKSFEDVLDHKLNIPKKGITEEVNCNETTNKMGTLETEVEDLLGEEPDASIVDKTSEECVPSEESQQSEAILAPESDIAKGGMKEEEGQRVHSGKFELNMENTTKKEEISSPEAHLRGNTVKASEVSSKQDNQQADETIQFPSDTEQLECVAAEKVEVEHQLRDVASAVIIANQSLEELELNDCQDVGAVTRDEIVENKMSETDELQEQLRQPSSGLLKLKHEATCINEDTEESAMTTQALKEEKSDHSCSGNTTQETYLTEETQRDETMDLQLKQELVEKASPTNETSLAELEDLSPEVQRASAPSESETQIKSESYADSSSQEITNESELQFPTKSLQTSTASPQNDSTSDNQEETDCSEHVSQFHGQQMTKSGETEEEMCDKVENRELLAGEHPIDNDFEAYETTVSDTRREKVNSSDLMLDARELLSEINASEPDKINVQKDENALEVTGRNEIDGSDSRNYEEVANQGSQGSSSSIEKPNQQTSIEVEASGLLIDAESTEKSTDSIKVIEVNEMDTNETGHPLNNDSTEEVKCVDKRVPENKTEEMDAEMITQEELNGSNAQSIPDERNPVKESERAEGTTAEEFDVPTDNHREKEQTVVAYNDNMPSVDDMALLEEETSLQEPHLPGNNAKALTISSTAETEQMSEEKPFPPMVEELENLAAKEAQKITWTPRVVHEPEDVASREIDANLSTRNLKVDGADREVALSDVTSPLKSEDVKEVTAADIIANQIALAIEAEEKLQQPSSEQPGNKHEAFIADKGKTTLDHQVMIENEEETLRKSCGLEDRKREVEVPSLKPINDLHSTHELAEEVRTTDDSSLQEREEMSSEFQGANPLLESETNRKSESCTDCSQEIPNEDIVGNLHETELTTFCPHIASMSRPEENFGSSSKAVKQTECYEQATELHGEGLTKSDGTYPEQHQKTTRSELIDEQRSVLNFEAHEATICDAAKVAHQKDVLGVSEDSLGEKTKAQSNYEDKQACDRSLVEDEKQQLMAKDDKIPDEKVSFHDPTVILVQQTLLATESPDKTGKKATVDKQETCARASVSLGADQTDEETTGKGNYIIAEIPKTDKSISALKTLESTEQIKVNCLTDDTNNAIKPKLPKYASDVTNGLVPPKYAGNTNEESTHLHIENRQETEQVQSEESGIRIEDDKAKDSQEIQETEDVRLLDNAGIHNPPEAKKEGDQNILKEIVQNREDAAVGEPKTEEEREEEIYDENVADLDSKVPMLKEAMRDMDLKATHKKQNNILSGVGSKWKHSISKVKKAIACSSAQFSQEDVIIKLNKNKKS